MYFIANTVWHMPDNQFFSVVHTIHWHSVFLPHIETSITLSEKSVKRSISAGRTTRLKCAINTVTTVGGAILKKGPLSEGSGVTNFLYIGESFLALWAFLLPFSLLGRLARAPLEIW